MNPLFRPLAAFAGPFMAADKEASAASAAGLGVQPTLEIAGQRRVPGPTDAQIGEAVRSLDATTTYAFLILDRDARHSLEVSGDAREGFELEHYEGGKGRRYRAVGDFTAEQVIALAIAYRDAAPGWQESMPWEELDE